MFKSKLRLRSLLLIDPDIQWPILQRTALYTGSCAVYFMVVLFCAESGKINHESPGKSLWHCLDVIACWAPGLTMLAPIIAYDLLIFTNRFAGPMFRLRREMQRLIADESQTPIKLRDNDHWTDMADLFNEIRSELIELRGSRSPMAKSLFGAVSSDDESRDSAQLETVEPAAVAPSDTVKPSNENAEDPTPDDPSASKSAAEFSVEDFDMPTVTKPKNAPEQPPTEDSAIEAAETPAVATEDVLGDPEPKQDEQLATAE